MNYILALVTLSALMLLIIYQVKTWKIRALMSPGFYFGCIWFLGVLGCVILHPLGLFYEFYPIYIDELNFLVLFTALCFIFYTRKGRDRINKEKIYISFLSYKLFKVLSIIFLIAAIVEFIRAGGNLNMGDARNNLHEFQSGQSTIIGYIQVLGIPLSIYSGYSIFSLFLSKNKPNINLIIWLLIPLFSNMVFSITKGGRVDFVYSFTMYLLGVTMAVPLNLSIKKNKKVIIIIAISLMGVVFFINKVGEQRDKNSIGYINETEMVLKEINPIIGSFSGIIRYMEASYVGYQHRRIDAVDENKLGYGQYTFNGFINWTLPFSSIIGLGDFSIAKALGIYYNNQETYDFEREYFYTTHSAYLTMIKDFGFGGALLCIYILVTVTHKLFIKIQKKKNIKFATSLYVFYLFWNYWVRSNFYGTLSSSILVPLYGFLIVDLLSYFLVKKK